MVRTHLSGPRSGLWLAVACLIGGCGMFGGGPSDCSKPQAYQESVSIDPVKVPEGLTEPDSTGTMAIPARSADSPVQPEEGPCLDAPPPYFREQQPEAEAEAESGD